MIKKIDNNYHTAFKAQIKLKRIKDSTVLKMFEEKTSKYPDLLLYQSHVHPYAKDEFDLVKKDFSALYYSDIAEFTANLPETTEATVDRLVTIFNNMLKKAKFLK